MEEEGESAISRPMGHFDMVFRLLFITFQRHAKLLGGSPDEALRQQKSV